MLGLSKRAESVRQNRRKFANNCKQFISKLYTFSRILLLFHKACVEFKSSKEEVEIHLAKAHEDPHREKPREDRPKTPQSPNG